MEDWVANSISNRVDWVSNSNWVSKSMSHWMSNKSWMSNSMSNWMRDKSWVSNSMGHRVSYSNSRSILGNSIIGDILNNSISIVNILDSLDPAIRKSHSVAARGGITISRLSLLEVGSTVVIIDTVLVSVHWGLSKVWGGIARGSNQGPGRGSGSNREEGSGKNSLRIRKFTVNSSIRSLSEVDLSLIFFFTSSYFTFILIVCVQSYIPDSCFYSCVRHCSTQPDLPQQLTF